MLQVVISLLFYVLMHYYIYRRISRGFALSPTRKAVIKLLLILLGGLFFIAHFIRIIFAVEIPSLFYPGIIWIITLPLLFTLFFLETGFSLIFPAKTHWWVTAALLLFAGFSFYISTVFRTGRDIPGYGAVIESMILPGFYFLANVIVYKIIAWSLKLPVKKRGILIIIFSAGAISIFLVGGIGLLSFLFGLYAVVYARLSAGLNLSKKTKRIVIVLLVCGFVISLPQMTYWGNGLGIDLLYFIGGLWYGMIVAGVSLFVIESGTALLFPRRAKLRVIIFLIILILYSGYAVFNASRVPQVKELTLPLKKLPEDMSGFTIVQWSDLHLGDLVTPTWLHKTIERTNALKPDLIVITGDLVDKGMDNSYINALQKLKARYGIIAVTGNHEYYSSRLAGFLEISKKVGIRVLRNESRIIARGIQIVGINDPTASGFGDREPNLRAAMKNLDPRKPVILLAHRPEFFEMAKKMGVDLQLSGHTHGGQFFPLTPLVYIFYSHPYGLYREDDTYLHTSCGTGIWGVPMRFLSFNEITRISLVKSK